MAESRGGFQKGVGALPGPAACPELFGLFLGRQGDESGRGARNASQGGRTEAQRRLYRRQPRLGALQTWTVRRRGKDPGASGQPETGRPSVERSSRRRILASKPPNRGAFSVESRSRHGTRAGRPARDLE